jgi:hypothetical protein
VAVAVPVAPQEQPPKPSVEEVEKKVRAATAQQLRMLSSRMAEERPRTTRTTTTSPLNSERTTSSSPVTMAMRLCQMTAEEVAQMASEGRKPISSWDEELVRKYMTETWRLGNNTQSTRETSLQDFIARKISEFEDHAAVGGVMWTRCFKWQWLQAGLPKTSDESSDAIRFY